VVFKDGTLIGTVDGMRQNNLNGWDNDHFIANYIEEVYNRNGKDLTSGRPIGRVIRYTEENDDDDDNN
jgi:hypothetical protein